MTGESFSLSPIGTLESCFPECFGTPRQGALVPASEAVLELTPELRAQGFFLGLESFSHVWILWRFHANESEVRKGKVYPPRLAGGKVGVFASRSPHRPNPLGLTLARLLAVEDDSLRLGGIDCIDGTPVFDIKPYVADADRPREFRGGWTDEVASAPVKVRFAAAAEEFLAGPTAPAAFRDLISQALALDPRPEASKAHKSKFSFRLRDWDVAFEYLDGTFEVVEIRAYDPECRYR